MSDEVKSLNQLSAEVLELLALKLRQKHKIEADQVREQRTVAVAFTREDLDAFAKASHDRNPLHLSAAYARKTSFGQPVVFGVLGGLACLGSLPVASGYRLSRVVFEFMDPMFVGVNYRVEAQARDGGRHTARMSDGRRTVLKVDVTYVPGRASSEDVPEAEAQWRETAADLDPGDLKPDLYRQGLYAPSKEALSTLVERLGCGVEQGVGYRQAAVIVGCSYLVGMEVPGRRALFYKLVLDFEDPTPSVQGPLAYQARVVKYDPTFGLAKIETAFLLGEAICARGELQAFARRDTPVIDNADVEALLPESTALQDTVSLITGGSRGFGAALSRTLALQGGTVWANYRASKAEVDQLRSETENASGHIRPVQGDAGDAKACGAMREELDRAGRRLDVLICNAFPPMHPLWFEPEAAERIAEYVGRSVAMFSTPMSAFLDLLAEREGFCVVVSSAFVDAPPGEWPHYVSAKYAVEGLARVVAVEYPSVTTLIVRPPRLLTDLTNTPLGSRGAMSTARAAAAVVRRLCGPKRPGQVEVLDQF